MAPCILVPAPCFELMRAMCALVFRAGAGNADKLPVNPEG
jgi:hypothetical protein